MEMKWIWVGLAVWLFLLYTAYSKYRRQVAAILSHQQVVADITKKILAGQSDDEILTFIKRQYKISGMAAVSSLSKIKQALAQRQAEKRNNRD